MIAKSIAINFSDLGRGSLRSVVVLAILAVGFVQPAEANKLEETLNKQWLGMWVLINQEAYSNCNGFFSNNNVMDDRLTGKGRYTFPAGELGRVSNVKVKRSRILILIEVEEPLLESRVEGPFTLFNEATCKVELRFDFDRKTIKDGDYSFIQESLNRILTAFPSRDLALNSEYYNSRECLPFPEDYEETLIQYEAWKQAQQLEKIQAKRDDSSREMERILNRVEDSPDYALGFVNGIRIMKRNYFPNCDQLLQFYPGRLIKSPESSSTSDYKRGFEDGQNLAFHQELLIRLKDCLK